MSDAATSLQTKLNQFQQTLSDDERLRLMQVRSVDKDGRPLRGQAGLDEARTRIAGRRDPSPQEKAAIHASLLSKLTTFESTLNNAELTELIAQRATGPEKSQSSFGVAD